VVSCDEEVSYHQLKSVIRAAFLTLFMTPKFNNKLVLLEKTSYLLNNEIVVELRIFTTNKTASKQNKQIVII
jgi:hypothetical protein